MENASKALLMAGGILISLIIIGVLLLMFNQLGAFQKAQSSSEKDAQLAIFNQEFAKYADETSIKGVDIISLANKVVDFNQKSGITNSVDYDQKITLNINLNGFADKYGVSGSSKLFKKQKNFNIKLNDNDFMKAIIQFSSLESQYTLSTMSKLSANYDSIASGDKTILEVTGKNIDITSDDIEKYREYSELKSSTFKPSDNPKYTNGQIVELSFEFVE